MRSIIIFGAGKYGKQIKRMIESKKVPELEEYHIEYFCDNNLPAGIYVEGVKVIHPYDIKRLEKEYDIVISTIHIMDEVRSQLKELRVPNHVYVVPEYVYKMKWNNDTMPFFAPLDIGKPRLPYVECKIVEHCNLKCNGCSVCANINKPEILELDEFENSLISLKRLFSGVKYFKLFGGEPLLHPQLAQFIKMTKTYFPDAEVVVHSNGILVPAVGDEVLSVMRIFDVKFVFTLYPETGKIKRIIEQKLGKYSVEYEFTPPVYEFRKAINIKGDYNPQEVYQNCCKCINLINGTLSCGMGFLMEKLEKKFDVKICEDKFQHCINIHSTEMTGEEINKLLDSPFNLCSYCAFMRFNIYEDETYYYKWKREIPKLEDWIC